MNRRHIRSLATGLVVLVGLLAAGASVNAHAATERATSAPAAPLIWTVTGPRGSLTLMGSIHALRATDLPLPPAYDAAYARASRLVFEVELDGSEVPEAMRRAVASGTLPADQTLRDALGATAWREAETLAAAAHLDLAPQSHREPWLAALDLTSRALHAAGLDAREGVDVRLLARARADKKPVLALETVADQFDLFDTLPIEEQRTLLLDALREAPGFEREFDELVEDWRRGDLGALVRWQDELASTPRLRAALFDARHARWLPKLETLLTEPTPTLVVVGAEHLVGEGSVLESLAARGYRMERAVQPNP